MSWLCRADLHFTYNRTNKEDWRLKCLVFTMALKTMLKYVVIWENKNVNKNPSLDKIHEFYPNLSAKGTWFGIPNNSCIRIMKLLWELPEDKYILLSHVLLQSSTLDAKINSVYHVYIEEVHKLFWKVLNNNPFFHKNGPVFCHVWYTSVCQLNNVCSPLSEHNNKKNKNNNWLEFVMGRPQICVA